MRYIGLSKAHFLVLDWDKKWECSLPLSHTLAELSLQAVLFPDNFLTYAMPIPDRPYMSIYALGYVYLYIAFAQVIHSLQATE